MMAGIFVLGFGIWILSQTPKKSGETEPRPETTPAEFTEWTEVERTQFVGYKLNPNPDGYFCIEQRDYKQGEEILFSQWRVQIKGTDNDYTVSIIYDSLEDAQAKVESMNQPPSKEDYEQAEEKGLIPETQKQKEDTIFSTPTFGGGK